MMGLDEAKRLLLIAEAKFDQQQAILRDAQKEVLALIRILGNDQPLTLVDRKFASAIVEYVSNEIAYRNIKRTVEELCLKKGENLDFKTTSDPEIMCGCECGCNINIKLEVSGHGCMRLCDSCAGK